MLTQLTTVKDRLALVATDTQYDALLTTAIQAISARFNRECRRILARTVDAIEEFDPLEAELCVSCYPLESVTRFDLKTSEAQGWQTIEPQPEYLIRAGCVIMLPSPLLRQRSTGEPVCSLARVLYTGGYVPPGTEAQPGQVALPPDLEQCAIEQVVFWFTNRDRVGVLREWPKGGMYLQFADIDLIPSVRAVLSKYAKVAW